jgi:hypothetical protein
MRILFTVFIIFSFVSQLEGSETDVRSTNRVLEMTPEERAQATLDQMTIDEKLVMMHGLLSISY